MSGEHYRQTTELPPDEALREIGETAEAWDADWHRDGFGGRLGIPFVAGLRRGFCSGRVTARATADGSEVTFEIESQESRVHRPAVGILVLGAAGGVTAMVAPFFWPANPELIGLVPVAGLLTLVAWFLVVSKLTSAGPQEFLEMALATPEERDPSPEATGPE